MTTRIAAVRASIRAILAASPILLLAGPAAAHHVMGGQLPSSFVEGLLSGLGHPIIGLDHLAFVVAVGLAAVALPHRLLMPLAFVAATVLGVAAHLAAFDLPMAEAMIALSVAAGGLLLISGRRIAAPAWLALFVVAGLLHGYAYGESIVGAEPAPLYAYLLGFSIVQYAIAIGAMLLTERLARRPEGAPVATRIAGGIVTGVGLVFLSEALLPLV
jgi:urease accessory protein